MNYAQANITVLPKNLAYDYLLFCVRNPKALPILEVIDAGNKESMTMAPGAIVTKDLPKYWVFEDGVLKEETTDVDEYWSLDMVTFINGCSYSFEEALRSNGLPVKHVEVSKYPFSQ